MLGLKIPDIQIQSRLRIGVANSIDTNLHKILNMNKIIENNHLELPNQI